MNGLGILFFLALPSIGAQLPDGFAVWSEGDAGNRTITMRTLKSDGTMGNPVKVVNKGTLGGDIQSQISFDGTWLAFCRSLGCRDNYGGDDYHEFAKWDLYIVRLDGSFPASPQKVGRGYWPSWADDSYNATKTLYYSTHDGAKTIRKVTVNNSGVVAGTDVKVQDIPGTVAGQSFVGFAMMAPNGKFMAWRGDNVCLYFFEDWMGKKAGSGYQSAKGCMPSITADSRWVLNAYHRKTRVGKTEESTGKGDYHFGTSQDLNWYINRTEGGADVQNKGYDITIFPVTIKGKEAKEYFDYASDLASSDYAIGSAGVSITSKGSWPDVHVTDGTVEDTTPPTVGAASAKDATTVLVTFSEAVAPASAQTKANYSLNNSATVASASLGADLRTVTLATSTLSSGITYTVTVSNIEDRAGNVMAASAKKTFEYVPFCGWKEDFDDGTADGWTNGGGTWNVSGGKYSNSGSGRMESFGGDADWDDITYACDITPGSGTDVWAIFRVQDASNYYLFTLQSSKLYKLVNASYTQLATGSGSFSTGTTYHIKVELNGSSIAISSNGTQVLTASDGTFSKGKAGFGSNNNTGTFDNAEVPGNCSNGFNPMRPPVLGPKIGFLPNPVTAGQLHEVQIFDFKGRLMHAQELKSGVYLVKAGDQVMLKRVLIR